MFIDLKKLIAVMGRIEERKFILWRFRGGFADYYVSIDKPLAELYLLAEAIISGEDSGREVPKVESGEPKEPKIKVYFHEEYNYGHGFSE